MPTKPMPDYRLLPDALDATVARFGGLTAMHFLGREWTYSELAAMVDAAAAGLQRLGVQRGMRVGLCLPNTPYSVALYYAVLKVGAVVVNFNPLYVPRELDHQIRDAGVTVMAAPDVPQILDKVRAVAEGSGLKSIIVCPMAEVMPRLKGLAYRLFKANMVARTPHDGRCLTFHDLVAPGGAPTPVEIEPDDLAVLQYTGGTTGVPKGAMLTHDNVAANAAQTLAVMDDSHPGGERVVAVLPLFHVFAMTAVMNCSIINGFSILLLPRYEIGSLLKLIHDCNATVLHAVPTIYGAINTEADLHGADLSSIKYCISGGAPLPAEIADHFRETTGAMLAEGYGLSETSPVVTCNPLDGGGKPGSVGPAAAGTVIEIRDLNDPGKIVGVGEKGEVCVRGPQVMKGYWNRPDETAEVFVDGALRTGDVGYLDEDGYLFLVDRIKDVIICSGFKVFPRILEEALYRHPAVAEAIVIGVPDPYRGQAPKAFVALKPDHTTTVEQLFDFMSGQVSKIEMPKSIEIRDALPKTAIGKPSKKDLIEQEKVREAADNAV